MKGYLLKEQAFVAGEAIIVESSASENNYAVAFEDDTETGYFYALEIDKKTNEQQVLDAVHIYQTDSISKKDRDSALKIIWSTDWLKCALIINNHCQAIFDFENQVGYNRNEFPPPNGSWTRQSKAMTHELIASFFK